MKAVNGRMPVYSVKIASYNGAIYGILTYIEKRQKINFFQLSIGGYQ